MTVETHRTHSECNEEMNKTQCALSAFRLQVSIYHPPAVRQPTHPEERQTAPLRQRSELTVAAECAVIRVMWVFSEAVGSRGRSGSRTGR